MPTEPKTYEPDRTHPAELVNIDRSYLVPWGQKEIVRAGLAGAVGMALLAWAAFSLSPLWAMGYLGWVPFVALLILFFRNPSRQVPGAPGLVVSPADGAVTDVTEVVEDEYLKGPAVRIGIFLSIFSVHVNRAPVAGSVEWVCHREGAHHDARKPECATENESNLIGILRDDSGGPGQVRVLVRQVSGAIARRIICPISTGTRVSRGGLVGMIKYGSRTEIFLPSGLGLRICVKPGDRVSGGSSILAEFPEA